MTSTAALSKLAAFGILVGVLSGLAPRDTGADMALARPDDGTVANGSYTNQYFDVSYPLLPGWTEGLAGPEPSHAGYYVLKSLVPDGELTGMILVAAQDQFFAPQPFADAMDMAADLGRAKSALEGVTVDRQPSQVPIGGRSFSRIDISGFGLFDSTFIMQARCHMVSFNMTANTPERLAKLVDSMHRITDAGRGGDGKADPTCVKSYAMPEHVVSRVHPAPVAPLSMPIPVRIIVAADGSVKHVHAIRATADQRTSIENALRQWKLKPYEVQGRATEVETGLIIQFTPEGFVRYSTSERPPRS